MSSAGGSGARIFSDGVGSCRARRSASRRGKGRRRWPARRLTARHEASVARQQRRPALGDSRPGWSASTEGAAAAPAGAPAGDTVLPAQSSPRRVQQPWHVRAEARRRHRYRPPAQTGRCARPIASGPRANARTPGHRQPAWASRKRPGVAMGCAAEPPARAGAAARRAGAAVSQVPDIGRSCTGTPPPAIGRRASSQHGAEARSNNKPRPRTSGSAGQQAVDRCRGRRVFAASSAAAGRIQNPTAPGQPG